MAQRQLYLYL